MLKSQASYPRPAIKRKPGSCTACQKAKVRCHGEPTCKRCEKRKGRCKRPSKIGWRHTSSTANMAAKKMADIGQKFSTYSLDPGPSSPIEITTPVETSENFSPTPCHKGQFDCRTESPTSTNYERSGSVCVSQQAPHRQNPRRRGACLTCRRTKRRVSPRHHTYTKNAHVIVRRKLSPMRKSVFSFRARRQPLLIQ